MSTTDLETLIFIHRRVALDRVNFRVLAKPMTIIGVTSTQSITCNLLPAAFILCIVVISSRWMNWRRQSLTNCISSQLLRWSSSSPSFIHPMVNDHQLLHVICSHSKMPGIVIFLSWSTQFESPAITERVQQQQQHPFFGWRPGHATARGTKEAVV